eukprot:TRINITY_DN113896_c0_g1_i1.p1 TRINITY_DN113896_c0_g1~~TRINITY_DN113896_c0_g1_i1.p1  ORF type:complete len:370 (-),score=94.43 TRINITY_DN113896_c0_g1_i1:65-1174(-)
MRRSWPPLLARRAAQAASGGGGGGSSASRAPPPDLRALRDREVAEARERIFGPGGSMPGDRWMRKPLEGRRLARWYFPSKYAMQDFRTEDYFEMQAERLAPREPKPWTAALTTTLRNVSRNREELRKFFGGMDEATFLNNPTLQDLYGLFRLVDPDQALPFEVPEMIFREHSPLFHHGKPLLSASPLACLNDLQLLIEGELGGEDAKLALQARISRLQSEDAVREVLLEEKDKHDVVPKVGNIVVALEGNQSVVEADGSRSWLAAYPASKALGGLTEKDRRKAMADAEKELVAERKKNKAIDKYLSKRHRFIDPMYRRRRLKWLERQMAGYNDETEVKFNSYYGPHPDVQAEWPTNKGSVTVTWPSPYH